MYGSDEIPPHASHFVPQFVVGARLPHVWIIPSNAGTVQSLPPVDVSYVKELPAEETSKRKYSVLDMCGVDAFTVLLADHGPEEVWAKSLRDQFATLGPKINIYTLGTDFELALTESGEDWLNHAGLACGGALLIRPDQHILMRFNAQTPVEQLFKVVNVHLGR